MNCLWKAEEEETYIPSSFIKQYFDVSLFQDVFLL